MPLSDNLPQKYRIIRGDIHDFARHAQNVGMCDYFHALLSDWPYQLNSIVNRFGAGEAAAAKDKDGYFARASAGFMGHTWDGVGIAYEPALWDTLMPILKPGAFTASFSHSRTQHLLAMAQIEAGYDIEASFFSEGVRMTVPAMLGWVYGSGNAMGTHLGKAIDKAAGAERPVIGQQEAWGANAEPGQGGRYANGHRPSQGQRKALELTGPATPESEIWEGYRYGNPSKPAIEPIILGQRPYDKGPKFRSIVKHGAGAMNIEGGKALMPAGKYPANFVLEHLPGCRPAGDRTYKNQSGSPTGLEPSNNTKNTYGAFNHRAGYDSFPTITVAAFDCAPGCPVEAMRSRSGKEVEGYFYAADWRHEVAENLAAANPAYYCSKPGSKERNAGLVSRPRLSRPRLNSGGMSDDPKWAPTAQQNNHPTLKPIALAKYLATLLLPPPEVGPRRILIPCSGVMSEAIGAALAGWDEIVCVELTPEYSAIGQARMEWWLSWIRQGITDVDEILSRIGHKPAKDKKSAPFVQPNLFTHEASS